MVSNHKQPPFFVYRTASPFLNKGLILRCQMPSIPMFKISCYHTLHKTVSTQAILQLKQRGFCLCYRSFISHCLIFSQLTLISLELGYMISLYIRPGGFSLFGSLYPRWPDAERDGGEVAHGWMQSGSSHCM